jgi:FkbM family methyltransferase
MTQRPPPSLPEDGFNEIVMCRIGPLLFNRHDQYVGASLRKYGEFSPGEAELFRQLVPQGAIVVEVGANIGAHTVELSKLAGPRGMVIAFEPQRVVFQTLCANLALNSCANVHAYPFAIGAEPGEILVPVLAPDQPNNFGGLSLIGAEIGEKVALRILDELQFPHCALIKLDLEGMEVEALRGGAALIARHRPVLYVENDRVERSAELVGLLRSWNYRLYEHTPTLFDPNNFAGDRENIFGNIVSINLLCLPAERGIVVNGMPEVAPPS